MMTDVQIHPTSVVEKGAELDSGVRVGPLCFIGPKVKIGKGTLLTSHVSIEGDTTLGEDNKLYPFVALGAPPQDLGYKDEPTKLRIGSRNCLREGFTAHRATTKADGLTEIGNDCLLMAYTHVAHDCKVGNRVIMANYAGISGHAIVEDFVTISGLTGVQQKARIGAYAFVAGATSIRRDLAPFMAARGDSEVVGPNLVGLKRAGFDEKALRTIRELYKIFFNKTMTAELALAKIEELHGSEAVAQTFLKFARSTVIGVQR
jgi:UDP-N-acetylglucosamine acyltransferase